jgi:predicted nucleotidyltransferase
MEAAIRAILSELENELRALYGPQLVRLLLFGSQARGDADEGSDIDVLVVLVPLPAPRGHTRPYEMGIVADVAR